MGEKKFIDNMDLVRGVVEVTAETLVRTGAAVLHFTFDQIHHPPHSPEPEAERDVETPSPKDAHIISVIDGALAEYDSQVEAWRVEDHKLAMDAVEWYEGWITREQNGMPLVDKK